MDGKIMTTGGNATRGRLAEDPAGRAKTIGFAPMTAMPLA
jgi:hypothetical protein